MEFSMCPFPLLVPQNVNVTVYNWSSRFLDPPVPDSFPRIATIGLNRET